MLYFKKSKERNAPVTKLFKEKGNISIFMGLDCHIQLVYWIHVPGCLMFCLVTKTFLHVLSAYESGCVILETSAAIPCLAPDPTVFVSLVAVLSIKISLIKLQTLK